MLSVCVRGLRDDEPEVEAYLVLVVVGIGDGDGNTGAFLFEEVGEDKVAFEELGGDVELVVLKFIVYPVGGLKESRLVGFFVVESSESIGFFFVAIKQILVKGTDVGVVNSFIITFHNFLHFNGEGAVVAWIFLIVKDQVLAVIIGERGVFLSGKGSEKIAWFVTNLLYFGVSGDQIGE